MKQIFFIFLVFLAFSSACTAGMIKKPEVVKLNQEHSRVYVAIDTIDLGNNETFKKGTELRLFFDSKGGSIKVYAYPAEAMREEVLPKNILYLFREDFPNKSYSAKFLEKRLLEKVQPKN